MRRRTGALALVSILSACIPQSQDLGKEAFSDSNSSFQAYSSPNNIAPTDADPATTKLAVGYQHVCALLDGKLWCWGLNQDGQIGNGESGTIDGTTQSKTVGQPTLVASGVSDVAVGYEHTCYLKGDRLACVGSNAYGQLGAATVSNASSAVPVEAARDIVQIASRARWSCAVTKRGALLCWGTRLTVKDGALASLLISRTPKEIIGENVKSIHLSATHGCALMTNGSLRCFGVNSAGELGLGDGKAAAIDTPTEVFASGVTQVALSDARSCVVHQGTMKCFGITLGDRAVDATADRKWRVSETKPYDAKFWDLVAPLKRISASGAVVSGAEELSYGSFFHNGGIPKKIAIGVADFRFSENDLVGCLLFRNRTMKCWGSNAFGQLGIGQASGEEFPITAAKDVVFP